MSKFKLEGKEEKFTDWDRQEIERNRELIDALYCYLKLDQRNLIPTKKRWFHFD